MLAARTLLMPALALILCVISSLFSFSSLIKQDLLPVKELVQKKSLTLSHVFCRNPSFSHAPEHTSVCSLIVEIIQVLMP